MREILFRGKRKDNGEWAKGSFWDEIPGELGGIAQYGSCVFHHVDLKTVGQYIGLTDKNGKKIFEGDIIEFKGCRWAVGFVNTAFAAMDGNDMQFAMFEQYIWDHKKRKWEAPSYWEVVGNIHDNPELLEEGDS